MASPEVEKLIGRAEREAEQQDIELDAVRKIESEADGITLRVLETDAESEEDQVGFQVTQPTGEFGYNMFQRSLKKNMRALRQHLRDDDDVDDESVADDAQANVSETPDTDPRQDEPTGRERAATSDVAQGASAMELSVALDDNSLEALQEEFDGFLEDVDEATVDRDRVDDLEGRIDDIDERLASIEEKLSLLALGDSEEAND